MRGVYASWVTSTILATSRPSEASMHEYGLLAQFREAGITAIFNLQTPGEHAFCGQPLIDGRFSYAVETFTKNGIAVRNFGWEDYGTPELESVVAMVTAMHTEIQRGGKVIQNLAINLRATDVANVQDVSCTSGPSAGLSRAPILFHSI